MEIFNGPLPLIDDSQTISTSSLMSFLLNSQKDYTFGNDVRTISNFITDFVQDPQRDVQEPYLTSLEVNLKFSLSIASVKYFYKI